MYIILLLSRVIKLLVLVCLHNTVKLRKQAGPWMDAGRRIQAGGLMQLY